MTAPNDLLGYFALLGLDPGGVVNDEDVIKAFRAGARICYPGGGGSQPDELLFVQLTIARDALVTAKDRGMYRRGLTASGEPLAGGLSYVIREPGAMANAQPLSTFRRFAQTLQNSWCDHRTRVGKRPMPFGRVWYNRVARYLTLTLGLLASGLFTWFLVAFWPQIFDVIHAIEWIIRRPVLLVLVVTLIVAAAVYLSRFIP